MPEQKDDVKGKKEEAPAEKPKDGGSKKSAGKKDKKKEDLSEEDLELKAKLELLVERTQDEVPEISRTALEALREEIRTSTSSMTSVPKPLKFLRPHYEKLKEFFNQGVAPQNKQLMADIMAVMAMTMADPKKHESLEFKLQGLRSDIGSWGHEFVRHLMKEIIDKCGILTEREAGKEEGEAGKAGGKEEVEKKEGGVPAFDMEVDRKPLPITPAIQELVDIIVEFFMKHNAEPDALDLLLEVGQTDKVMAHVEESNFARVCLYMTSCTYFLLEPEYSGLMRLTLDIYMKFNKPADALRVAVKLGDQDAIDRIYRGCEDPLMKKQLALILGSVYQHVQEDDEELAALMNNKGLSERYLDLGKDMDVLEPKSPEDVFKSHLVENRTSAGAGIDSARQNLAASFVNAFVNAGFRKDKLIIVEAAVDDKDVKWIHKNKEHGMMSAAASIGLISLWDVDGGLAEVDKYMYAKEDFIKAGCLLGVGILNCGVRDDCDPALALLADHTSNYSSLFVAIGAVSGLGIAYAGSCRDDLMDPLVAIIEDAAAPMELIGAAALALGQIFVGSCHSAVSALLLATLLERGEEALGKSSHTRFICLGLGLLYLSQREAAETTLDALMAVPEAVGKYATLTVQSCAYACSGNVLEVQSMLQLCGEHPGAEGSSSHQAVAVLGIAMVAMGEELGSHMAVRTLGHLLQYGDPAIRRAVPLAVAMLSLSRPQVTTIDKLSKLSHDTDAEVAQNAIFALGLIGAGTNNAKIALLLRQLSSYYYKDPNHLFVVRVAQGLVHLGKGLLTLSPFTGGGMLCNRVALAGILATMHAFFDIKNTILGKHHYLLYHLVLAMRPGFMMALDSDLKLLPVSVRVGQAVDTVGQAGKPKTITGFQTHTSPVLLAAGERVELVSEEYLPMTDLLEGFVILKPNPDYKQPSAQ